MTPRCHQCLSVALLLTLSGGKDTVSAQFSETLNGILGEPTVDCRQDIIHIRLKTASPFMGNLYTKGYFHNRECRVKGWLRKKSEVEMNIPVGSECGTRRKRVNPRGIVLETTVILMFHRLFLTKIDKSYHIECFYMQYDNEVSQSYDVSLLPPSDLPAGDLARSSLDDSLLSERDKPTCKYEVLSGGPQGRPLKYARIGDLVYHKWSCSGDEDAFCMMVHSCIVDDGQGEGQQLIDEDGFAAHSKIVELLSY